MVDRHSGFLTLQLITTFKVIVTLFVFNEFLFIILVILLLQNCERNGTLKICVVRKIRVLSTPIYTGLCL